MNSEPNPSTHMPAGKDRQGAGVAPGDRRPFAARTLSFRIQEHGNTGDTSPARWVIFKLPESHRPRRAEPPNTAPSSRHCPRRRIRQYRQALSARYFPHFVYPHPCPDRFYE